MRQNLSPAGVRRLFTFIPAKATVTFGGSTLLPATTLKVDYFYLSGLFERIYLLHKARCFGDQNVLVELQDGRTFAWNGELAHQCFCRRKPNVQKLMSIVPQI